MDPANSPNKPISDLDSDDVEQSCPGHVEAHHDEVERYDPENDSDLPHYDLECGTGKQDDDPIPENEPNGQDQITTTERYDDGDQITTTEHTIVHYPGNRAIVLNRQEFLSANMILHLI
ncbi:MAG: hypothetical protein MHMPM18_002093 [Marteilia pararefringens]